MIKLRRVASCVTVAALFLFLSGLTPLKQISTPKELAGLKLIKAARGKDAITQVNQLHGKSIPVKDALVATYQGPGAQALLWVGEVESEERAASFPQRMAAAIERGGTPFSDLKVMEIGDKKVYSAVGQGKNHYFYASSNKIIWVEAQGTQAAMALHKVFSLFK